jgi:hypothetical protein
VERAGGTSSEQELMACVHIQGRVESYWFKDQNYDELDDIVEQVVDESDDVDGSEKV